MALGVVEHLEPVEVQEEHRGGAAPCVGGGEGVAYPVVQQRPVGQPGQGVVQGLVPQRQLQPFPVPDVARDGRHAQDVAVDVPQWRQREQDVHEGAVPPSTLRLERCHHLAAGGQLEEVLLVVGGARGDEVVRPPADHLRGRVPEEPLRPGVPAGDDPGPVLADDGVLGRLDDRREPDGGLQLPPPLGDVHLDTGHPVRLAGVVEGELPLGPQPVDGAVGPGHPELDVVVAPAGHRLSERDVHPPAVAGVHVSQERVVPPLGDRLRVAEALVVTERTTRHVGP